MVERVFIFHFLISFADVDETLYESGATGRHLNAVRFNPHTNMADARTCRLGSTPAPLSLGSSNNVL